MTNVEVTDLQRVLITYGNDDESEIKKQQDSITDKACIYSEKCAARITPGNLDKEPCSGIGPCTK